MTGRRAGTALATVLVPALGTGAGRVAWQVLTARPPGGAARWARTNHRGGTLTLLEGPAVALAAAATVATAPGTAPRLRAAGVVATLGAGVFGLLDDLAERGGRKGLRGHLTALRHGEVTTGAVKVAGIGATGLAAAALALPFAGTATRAGRSEASARIGGSGRAARAGDVLVAGAVVAGAANLANLLDLRPGRALKAGLAAAATLVAVHRADAGGSGRGARQLASACAGPALALLPEDLGERAMLGDCGANAVGALLGTAFVAGSGRRGRAVALGVLAGLTLASEKVSFTRVIEATPVLRELDALGRRGAGRGGAGRGGAGRRRTGPAS